MQEFLDLLKQEMITFIEIFKQKIIACAELITVPEVYQTLNKDCENHLVSKFAKTVS